MWLILCSPYDQSGVWAYHGLKLRSREPVELVTTEMLACAVRFEHRVGTDGSSLNIELADGRTISSRNVKGTVNRVLQVPDIFAGSPDRDYATQELTALLMSLLYCLPGLVLNPPTPQGLSGRWRHPSEWAVLAHGCGLATRTYSQSSRSPDNGVYWQNWGSSNRMQSAIVLGHRVFPRSLPAGLADGCRTLAAVSETPLLGLDFVQTDEGGWIFAGASPCPDFVSAGEEFLDGLAEELGSNQKEVAA
ncbi:MAG TPA: hypothetical protein VKJ45_29195 [Blastocatellia bacterium]|nr:hypothetical protein [Blastocatellia bacterium]